MADRIIKPMSSEGKITIPKELRTKYNLKDYVEVVDTEEGILIKPL